MKEKIEALLNAILIIVYCIGFCYLMYVGYSAYKYYNEDNIVQERVIEDPDYQDWEDSDWESRIYTIDELIK